MASLALVPARRAWLAVAIMGAMVLLLAPAAQAQEATTELPSSVDAAVTAAAAAQASVPEADVEALRVEAVTWNDGCLGVEAEGEACTQALVDGYVAWVVAGGAVHRFHTDSESEVRLGQTGILTSAVATAPLPEGATAREEDGGSIFSGDIPASGVALFQLTVEASTDDIRSELQAQGCTAGVLAKTVSGQWYIYGYDSPDFANAGFFSSDGSTAGMVSAETILLTNCIGGATPSPTPTPGAFSSDAIDELSRSGAGALTSVTVGAHEGYERIVFEFGDTLGGGVTLAQTVPAYSVSYEAAPTACGSGDPVMIDGEAMLVVHLPGTFSYDPDAGTPLATEPALTGVESIMGVDQSCAFEANSTWVFGIDSEAGYRVSELSSPTRLVVDIETDATP